MTNSHVEAVFGLENVVIVRGGDEELAAVHLVVAKLGGSGVAHEAHAILSGAVRIEE